ncbi:hypothetical protein [Corynebacterium camporealensis]|uniref:hypothetical protein n=1 Tax=Corynebacterium camporealensis TaxID=161896 RepID=UPI000ABCC8AB
MSMRTRGLALCTALACSTALAVTPAQAVIVDNVLEDSAPNASVSLEAIGAYDSGILGESAAEIVAFHAESERILTVNARSGEVDILDASDPTNPQHIGLSLPVATTRSTLLPCVRTAWVSLPCSLP